MITEEYILTKKMQNAAARAKLEEAAEQRAAAEAEKNDPAVFVNLIANAKKTSANAQTVPIMATITFTVPVQAEMQITPADPCAPVPTKKRRRNPFAFFLRGAAVFALLAAPCAVFWAFFA